MSKNKTKNKSNKLEELDGFLKNNNSDLKSVFGYPKVMKNVFILILAYHPVPL